MGYDVKKIKKVQWNNNPMWSAYYESMALFMYVAYMW